MEDFYYLVVGKPSQLGLQDPTNCSVVSLIVSFSKRLKERERDWIS